MNHVVNKAAKTIFGKNFVSGPYERVFFEPGEERQYIRNYLDLFNGKVEYAFRLEEYFNLLVVGLQSELGDVSLVVIAKEDRLKLPEYIQDTRMMYVVDSIDEVYRKAKLNGIPILQKRTPNIMGAQGALRVCAGLYCRISRSDYP